MPVERREQVTCIGIVRVNGQPEELAGSDGRRQPLIGGTSRMNREIHVRICERLGVQFPGATRPFPRRCRQGNEARGGHASITEGICQDTAEAWSATRFSQACQARRPGGLQTRHSRQREKQRPERALAVAPFPFSKCAVQNGPERSRARRFCAAERTLDGEDRSERWR